MKKTILITVGVLLILGIVGGGIYWWKNKLDTSSWQVYSKSDPMNISISYPNDWLALEDYNNEVLFISQRSMAEGEEYHKTCDGADNNKQAENAICNQNYNREGFVVYFIKNPLGLDLKEWVKRNVFDITSQENITLSGYSGGAIRTVDAQIGIDQSVTSINIAKDYYIIQIRKEKALDDALFNRIIGTIKL